MPELFSVNEAAAIAEVSPETIRMALEKKSVVPAGKRKTGKTVRYQFSIGDVRFIKVLDEFPFPLSKRDKQCLAQILAPGKKLGRPWSMQGPDLIYSAGSVRMSFQCKTIRETVDRNAAVLRWGKKTGSVGGRHNGRGACFSGKPHSPAPRRVSFSERGCRRRNPRGFPSPECARPGLRPLIFSLR